MKKLLLLLAACTLFFGCVTTGSDENEIEDKEPVVTETKEAKTKLTGSKWILTEILDEDGVGDTVDTDTMTLSFLSKKKAVFDTGINILNCGVSLNEDESTITFEQGPMTLKSGDDKSMYLEMFMLETLGYVVSYSMEEDTLILQDSNSNPRLIYILKK